MGDMDTLKILLYYIVRNASKEAFMPSNPTYIEVANFSPTDPNYQAIVSVWPNGTTRINDRTGWTHDKHLDYVACEAAKVLAAEQKSVVIT